MVLLRIPSIAAATTPPLRTVTPVALRVVPDAAVSQADTETLRAEALVALRLQHVRERRLEGAALLSLGVVGTLGGALVAVVAARCDLDPEHVATVLSDGPIGDSEALVRLADALSDIRQEVLDHHVVR